MFHERYLRFIMGNPMGNLEADIRLLLKQLRDWKLTVQMDFAKMIHQTILNLMGQNENYSVKLAGEVFSEEDHRHCSQTKKVSAALRTWEGSLFTYFGDHVRQANAAIQYGQGLLREKVSLHPLILVDTF